MRTSAVAAAISHPSLKIARCLEEPRFGIIERVGTASLRSRTCVKRNAVFGARFKGLSLESLYQKGNLIRIKTGLDAYLIRIQPRTPLSRYPPYDYSKRCVISLQTLIFSAFWGDNDFWGDAPLAHLFLWHSWFKEYTMYHCEPNLSAVLSSGSKDIISLYIYR